MSKLIITSSYGHEAIFNQYNQSSQFAENAFIKALLTECFHTSEDFAENLIKLPRDCAAEKYNAKYDEILKREGEPGLYNTKIEESEILWFGSEWLQFTFLKD